MSRVGEKNEICNIWTILPFVKSCRSLFGHHGPCTVEGTPVLSRRRVHVSRFHHIYWGSNHRGNEASTERGHKVARQVVCGEEFKKFL